MATPYLQFRKCRGHLQSKFADFVIQDFNFNKSLVTKGMNRGAELQFFITYIYEIFQNTQLYTKVNQQTLVN